MPRFAISTALVASTDQRIPYSSRTSSARPLPVTTPMRAASICTSASEIVISTIVHSRLVAVLGADGGIGGDPAGVVAGVGRDQTRAEQAEKREDAGAARAKTRRQTWSATDGRPDTTHDGGTRTAIELSAWGLH